MRPWKTWVTWSQDRGTIAPPSPGRHGTSFTFLQFLHNNVTYVAFALVLEAAMTIPDTFTSFEIYCAYMPFCQESNIFSKMHTLNKVKRMQLEVSQLTPSERIETGSCSDLNSTCTSPGTGSSISPVSPWTLDLRPARTSAAAFSNWFIFRNKKEKVKYISRPI